MILSILRKTTYPFFIPGGMLLTLALTAGRHPSVAVPLDPLLPSLPYLLALLGVLIGWRFHRWRMMYAVVALTLAGEALGHFPETLRTPLLHAALAFLLPLNLALVALGRGGSLTPARGAIAFTLLSVQAAALAWLRQHPGATVAAWFREPWPAHPFPYALALPHPAQAALLLALLIAGAAFARRPTAMEASFVWALAACGIALEQAARGTAPSLLFATAGAILVGGLLENSHFLAYRDDLTRLPARRAFNEACRRLGPRFAVAMVDIDHFKKINDTHGHDVGDQVLRMVAARLGSGVKRGTVYRYGGEEFAILYPGRTLEEISDSLETLRARIAGATFAVRAPGRPRRRPPAPVPSRGKGRNLKVTVSIGAAEGGGRKSPPEATVKSADKALYRAKRAGRNRVCH